MAEATDSSTTARASAPVPALDVPGRAGATAPTQRLTGIDAARGLALIGMIVVNVGPVEADGLLHRLYLLPYGRASVLFVVIAGIGMGLMLRPRPGAGRQWRVVVWRAAVLLLGGLALQRLTDDVSVILPVYGVLFLLALLVHRAPRAVLLGLALAMTVVGPVLYVSHLMAAGRDHHSGPPLELGNPVAEVLHGLVLSGRYPLVTWCVPFLVGLWFSRLDLRDRGVLARLVVWGTVAAVVAFGLSLVSMSILDRDGDVGAARLLTGAAHGQMPLWLVSSVGGALAVVAGLVLLGARGARVAGPLVAAGRLALTLYVLHVLVLALLTPADGFTLARGAAVSALMIASFLGLAVVWRRVTEVGPLEWVLRASWLRTAA
ncbi:DUF418 domain-containing protein [Actinotalea sp. Marseille-Q4924]|uniref:DUF418 domain-containing protein n=1 Tax=Actinotalea sp. Marseille-Q4924 TaxID=2866571 RepID=UPI001CE3BDB0|nr:DUF418 domain-containing protein [Actinotalea sp. Marseille-Q4924]